LLALERIAIVAHIFRVAQIPIAERAAPSAHFTRGFVPWRLSDDGPGASRTVSMAVIRNPSQKQKKQSGSISSIGPGVSLSCQRLRYLLSALDEQPLSRVWRSALKRNNPDRPHLNRHFNG
jgi:hypothetical protein